MPFRMHAHPDLSQMAEVKCPDCGQQLFILREGREAKATMGSCRCAREAYEIPMGTVAHGIQGTPQFLYAPRSQHLSQRPHMDQL